MGVETQDFTEKKVRYEVRENIPGMNNWGPVVPSRGENPKIWAAEGRIKFSAEAMSKSLFETKEAAEAALAEQMPIWEKDRVNSKKEYTVWEVVILGRKL